MQIQKSKIAELEKLHAEIAAAAQSALERAIAAGEILMQIKAQLEHGAWGNWLRDNVSFSQRSAADYMRVYCERDKLKLAAAANLKSSLRLLSDKKKRARVSAVKTVTKSVGASTAEASARHAKASRVTDEAFSDADFKAHIEQRCAAYCSREKFIAAALEYLSRFAQ